MRRVGWVSSLGFASALVVLAALPGLGTGSVEYQTVSLDMNGDPSALRDYGRYYLSMQVFAPFSISSDGSSVVYAKRNGTPTDDGYVPMAANEFCNDNGECRDIYIHDLASGTTDSVTDYVEWTGHVLSGPSVGFGANNWAASSDHTRFAMLWGCWTVTFGDGTICDGNPDPDPPYSRDDDAVVWVDIQTQETAVLNVRSDGTMGESGAIYHSPTLLMSADGHTVVFRSNDELVPRGPVCLLWDCFDSGYDSIYVWRHGAGVEWITADIGLYPDDQTGDHVIRYEALSGDGRYLFFVVEARVIAYDPADDVFVSYVVRHEIDTGDSSIVVSSPVKNSWSAYIFGNLAVDHDGSTVVVAGSQAPFGVPNNVWLIDVAAADFAAVADLGVPGAFCSAISITPDGTVAACDRNNFGPPMIIDLTTGEVHDFATEADGFGESGYEGPYIGPDGNTVVVASQRLSDPDHVFGALQVRVATLTDGPDIPPHNGRFVDDNGNVHEQNIEAIADIGVTLGCTADGLYYCPADPVTRAQMASFLVRAFAIPTTGVDYFPDDNGNTHEANINALREAEITFGCGDGTNYCPNDLVSRAQMASFIARAMGLVPIAGDSFTDVSGTHAGNIYAIRDAGITLGCNPAGTQYCPNVDVPRDQMASFIARALGIGA